MKEATVFFDGGCKPNPGKMEVGIVFIEGKETSEIHRYHKHGTNNEAEWISFLLGVKLAQAKGVEKLTVYGDSSIVVNQANGTWKCKSENLIPYLEKFKLLKDSFTELEIKFIRRDKNLAGIMIEEKNK